MNVLSCANVQTGATVLSPNPHVVRLRTLRRARRRAERVRHSVRLSGCRTWCPDVSIDARRWHRRREPCGEHHGLPHAFARQPRFRPPQHGSWADPPALSRADARAAHGERSVAKARPRRLVRVLTKSPLKLHGGHAGRPQLATPDVSGPEPDVQRSVATLHHCSHRQLRCSGGTCGSAGRQGGFQKWNGSFPPCRSAGRQSRLPSGLSPGSAAQAASSGSRWNSGSECGNGRSARSRTSMARSPISGLRPF